MTTRLPVLYAKSIIWFLYTGIRIFLNIFVFKVLFLFCTTVQQNHNFTQNHLIISGSNLDRKSIFRESFNYYGYFFGEKSEIIVDFDCIVTLVRTSDVTRLTENRSTDRSQFSNNRPVKILNDRFFDKVIF